LPPTPGASVSPFGWSSPGASRFGGEFEISVGFGTGFARPKPLHLSFWPQTEMHPSSPFDCKMYDIQRRGSRQDYNLDRVVPGWRKAKRQGILASFT